MFSPKLTYLNISHYISFYDKDNSIFKQDSDKLRYKEFKSFSNHPMSGWKLSVSKYIPFNAYYSVPSFFLTHPTDDSISFAVENLFDLIPSLSIINGVIQNQLIIVNDNMTASVVIEGTPEFDLALQSLNNQSSSLSYSIKDLSVGDIVSFKSKYKSPTGFIYLGSFFNNSIFKTYSNKLFIYSPLKSHFFCFYNEKMKNLVIFTISSFKDLDLLGHNSSFSNFNLKDSFNNNDISFFKQYFNLSSDSLYSTFHREIFFLDDSKYELHNKDFYRNLFISFFPNNSFVDSDIEFVSSKISLKNLVLD